MLRLASFCLWVLTAIGQTSSISGVVLDSRGKPIPRIPVELSTADSTAGALEITDAEGRYVFSGLPKGSYRLFVQPIRGYLLLKPVPPVALLEGEARKGVVVRMVATGSISGTVLDDLGDPVVNADVRLLRRSIQRGQPVYLSDDGGTTDDRGRYRIARVKPGGYFIGVRSNNITPATEGQRATVHAVQFWRGADNPTTASPLLIVPGTDLTGVDFQLQVANTSELRGRVLGLPENAPGNLSVKLLPLDLPSVGSHAFTFTLHRDGRFEYKDVLPGRYLLVADYFEGQEFRAGTTTVRITAGDAASADVTVEPPTKISGVVSGDVPPKGPRVRFVSADSTPGVLGINDVYAEVKPDGTFQAAVRIGKWDIAVDNLPAGAYVHAMRLGKEDVLRNDMTVGAKTREPLHIEISSKGATIEGTAEGADVILIAPQGEPAANLGFYYLAPVDRGRFAVRGVRPGAYVVYAFEYLEASEWQEAGFLKPFTGTAVEVREREAKTVKLPVIRRITQ